MAITFVAKSFGSSFTSPFTGQTQAVSFGGQYWEADIQFTPLLQADAEVLMGFIVSLGGQANQFYWKPPPKFLITSTQNITVTGDGTTFTGGSGIQIGKFGVGNGRLIQFTSPTTIFPRQQLGALEVNTTNNAVWRLTTNDQSFLIDNMMMGQFAMTIRESF